MVLDRQTQDLGRKCIDYVASSVVDAIDVDKIIYENRPRRVPLLVNTDPDVQHSFHFKIDPIREVDGEVDVLIVETTGAGLIYINETLEMAVDGGHRLVPLHLKGKKGNIELKLTSRGMFGTNPWYLRIDGIHVAKINWKRFQTGLFLLNLYDCLLNTTEIKKREELRYRIRKTLPKGFAYFDLKKAIGSFWLINTLRTLIPSLSEMVSDYGYLADLYSPFLSGEGLVDPSSRLVEASSDNNKSSQLTFSTKSEVEIYFFGHAHIDVAWLWPLSETRRKVFNTFLNMIRLMQSGYDFTFAQSTSLYYEIFKEQSNDLYSDLVNLVKAGKWVVAGGMYVESDTNLIPSEALARQFLYGQEFFLKEFGRTAQIGWLPDSFGFSGQLPQLMKKARIKVFVTHKMMWNDSNEFPFHSFNWIGIDGSAVPSQIIVHGYNVTVRFAELLKGIDMFKQKGTSPMICAYGLGDGGGGPNIPMIEWLKQIQYVPGLSGSVVVPTETGYVKSLSENNLQNSIQGELYLERHRGVYTTNITVKKLIAELEQKVRFLELGCSLWSLKTGKVHFDSAIDSLWKLVLLNCFHDILPGSANHEAYQESFASLRKGLRETDLSIMRLAAKISGRGSTRFWINPIQWECPISPMEVKRDTGGSVVKDDVLPPLSISFSTVSRRGSTRSNVIVERNDSYEIIFPKFRTSIDKTNGRMKFFSDSKASMIEIGNIARLYQDEPGEFDAWEITKETLNEENEVQLTRTSVTHRTSEEGATVIVVKQEFADASVLTQEISFLEDTGTVRVNNYMKLASKLRLFKVYFKPNRIVENVDCQIPFGFVERKVEEMKGAMFEFPCLNWLSYGDESGRFSLMSQHLHGYGFHDNMISITLGKFPLFPDPWSGLQSEEVTFYISPFSDNPRNFIFTEMVSRLMDRPFYSNIHSRKPQPLTPSNEVLAPLKLESTSVVLDAMTISHDRKGIVLRMHEASGRNGTCRIRLNEEYPMVETDLLEIQNSSSSVIMSGDLLSFSPFEIKTIKILL